MIYPLRISYFSKSSYEFIQKLETESKKKDDSKIKATKSDL